MSAVEPLAVSRMTGDRAALAQLAHDLDAVEVGHDDVEQDDVRPDLLGLQERFLAAVGGDDAEALLAQGDRDELRDPGLVVGDEHERLGAHRFLLGRTMVTDMRRHVIPRPHGRCRGAGMGSGAQDASGTMLGRETFTLMSSRRRSCCPRRGP